MKISLNWLKKLVKVNVQDDDLIRLIGARLVEVEGVIDETHKYDKIYVVRVEKAERIPDTHLTLCQIDVGDVEVAKVEKNEAGLVQVVCGAPNVREGMLAVWIAPGATVPASVHEDAPFVIGKRKMLGKYESYGMLAGADELDFGADHTGIVEINPVEAKARDALADVYELDDKILEIENKSLTHRPDCFGMVGFAREVAGILGEKFEYVVTPENVRVNGGIEIRIEDAQICSRYTAMVLEKHGEIGKKYLTWTDTVLSKAGMRPVSPIVDATNYLMLLTGQPLHAFDYDKFVKVGGAKRPKIIVRLAREGETLELIDGKTIELTPTDIVICSNDVPVALAGAMGGASTEIDDETRNVIIEAATFSLYNLRKTQMTHGIFSEAITRFTKGQPPYQTLVVAEACANLLADGYRISEVSDFYAEPEKPGKVVVRTDEINALLGTEYSDGEIVRTLENVGFTVKDRRGGLTVTVPEWRTDIHIAEDIIEEIGRINGYDNIVPTLPRHATAERGRMWDFKSVVRDTLRSFGGNEVLTYSFVSERLLKKAGLDVENSYKIVNSISPELQLIRQSLVPSLLEKAYMNQKFPVDRFAIFEINKVYQKLWGMNEEGVPVESMRVAMVIAERKGEGTAFYMAKNYVEKMLDTLGVTAEYVPLAGERSEDTPYEAKHAAAIIIDGRQVGVVGEFKNSVKRNFKLAEYLAGWELDMDALLAAVRPKVVRTDFEVKNRIDETVTTEGTYADALTEVRKKYPDCVITPVGIYQPNDSKAKNITFHIEFY